MMRSPLAGPSKSSPRAPARNVVSVREGVNSELTQISTEAVVLFDRYAYPAWLRTHSLLVGRIADSNGWAPGLNSGPGIVVTNVHLLASYLSVLGPGSFDLMIVDEAYQLSASDFEVSFVTPLMVYAARQPARRTTSKDTRVPPSTGSNV